MNKYSKDAGSSARLQLKGGPSLCYKEHAGKRREFVMQCRSTAPRPRLFGSVCFGQELKDTPSSFECFAFGEENKHGVTLCTGVDLILFEGSMANVSGNHGVTTLADGRQSSFLALPYPPLCQGPLSERVNNTPQPCAGRPADLELMW